MQVKEILRRSSFENYNIKFEGEDKTHFVNKDKAFEKFGLMYVTDIDYSIIFASKEDGSHQGIVALNLLVIDKDKVYI